MKKHQIPIWIIIFLSIIIIIPFIVLLILNNSLDCGIGSNDAWIGFYGAYFGAIISGLITLVLVYTQFKYRENGEKAKDNAFVDFIIYKYFGTVKRLLNDSVKKIEDKLLVEDDVAYLPFANLFYSHDYYYKISNINSISNDKKHIILSVFSGILSLNYLLECNIHLREDLNINFIQTNVNITNARLLALALKYDVDNINSVHKNIDNLFNEHVYKTINEDARTFVKTSIEILSQIKQLEEK